MKKKMNKTLKLLMTSYFCACFFILVLHVIKHCIFNNVEIYAICEVIAIDFRSYFLAGAFLTENSFMNGLLEKLFFIACFMAIGIIRFCFEIRKCSHEVCEENTTTISQRDYSIDILKGLLIIIMIIGHSTEIVPIKNIIYSVHMPAFVITSGYFYKKRELKVAIPHLIKMFLVPYTVFSVIDLLLKLLDGRVIDVSSAISKYVLGVSFSNKIFVEAESVGPIYFLLVLFGVRLIYAVIDNCFQRDYMKIIFCLIVSLLGWMIGVNGFWLPWSFDCAMYAIMFYMIGYYLRRYQILQKISENLYIIVVLIGIWAYMIYNSNFEIAFRFYYPYILVIIGATCGTVVLCLLSRFLHDEMPRFFVKSMSYIGNSTLYILIVHTLYRDFVAKYVEHLLDSRYVYNLIISIILQVILGVLIKFVVEKISRIITRRENAKKYCK